MAVVNLQRIDLRDDLAVATFLLAPDRQGTVNTFVEIRLPELPENAFVNQHITMPAWAELKEKLSGWMLAADYILKGGTSLIAPRMDGGQFNVRFQGMRVSSFQAHVEFLLEPELVSVVVNMNTAADRQGAEMVKVALQQLIVDLQVWLSEAEQKGKDPETHFQWTGSVDISLR